MKPWNSISPLIKLDRYLFLDSLQSQDHMAAQTAKLTNAVHPLVRSGLYVDPPRRGLEQLDDIVLHPRLEVGYLGPFQNQCHINVADLITVVGHHLVGVFHKFGRIATLPSGIGILKHLADIGQCQCTKDPIDDGVIYHIAVGMCHHTQLSFVNSALLHVFALRVGPLASTRTIASSFHA